MKELVGTCHGFSSMSTALLHVQLQFDKKCLSCLVLNVGFFYSKQTPKLFWFTSRGFIVQQV